MDNTLQPQVTESDVGAPPDARILAPGVLPDGATRFRRYCLGVFDLISALIMAGVTVTSAVAINGQFLDYQAAGTRVPAAWIAAVVAMIVGFSVVSLGGLLIGIWNLGGLKTMSPAPLVAAIVYSSISSVMTAIFLNQSGTALGLALMHGLVIVMTIRILRHEGMKSLKDVRRRIV